jgi:hypothetical protein
VFFVVDVRLLIVLWLLQGHQQRGVAPLTIGRIIFSWVIEKDDSKKAKNAVEADTAHKEWPWQGLMESLQQMQPELYVVIDLIGKVGTCVHTPDLASYECNTAT